MTKGKTFSLPHTLLSCFEGGFVEIALHLLCACLLNDLLGRHPYVFSLRWSVGHLTLVGGVFLCFFLF